MNKIKNILLALLLFFFVISLFLLSTYKIKNFYSSTEDIDDVLDISVSFRNKIIDIVQQKDLFALANIMEKDIKKYLIREYSNFDSYMSFEIRNTILNKDFNFISAGYRGYAIQNNDFSIWYRCSDKNICKIYSLDGLGKKNIETYNELPALKKEILSLSEKCFFRSGLTYDIFYFYEEKLGLHKGQINWNLIGQFLGKEILIQDNIMNGVLINDGNHDIFWGPIAAHIDLCVQRLGNSNKEFSFDSSYVANIEFLPLKFSKLLAPNLLLECESLFFLEIMNKVSGSLNGYMNYGIYGVFIHGEKRIILPMRFFRNWYHAQNIIYELRKL